MLGGPRLAPRRAAAIFPAPRRRLSGGLGTSRAAWGRAAPGGRVARLHLFFECPLCLAGGMPRGGAGPGRVEEQLRRSSCHVGGAKRI